MRDTAVVPVESARLKPRLGSARPHPLSPSPPCGEGGRSARHRLGGRAELRVHSRLHGPLLLFPLLLLPPTLAALAAIDSIGPRQAGPGHATASGGLDVQFQLGRVVAVTHPYFDTQLKYDPDWYGYKKRLLAGRTAESYLSAQWPIGEVLFGRLDR